MKPQISNEEREERLKEVAEWLQYVARGYAKQWQFPVKYYLIASSAYARGKRQLSIKEIKEWAIANGYITELYTMRGALTILPADHTYTATEQTEMIRRIDELDEKGLLSAPSHKTLNSTERVRQLQRKAKAKVSQRDINNFEKIMADLFKLQGQLKGWLSYVTGRYRHQDGEQHKENSNGARSIRPEVQEAP